MKPTHFVPTSTYSEEYFWGWTYYLPVFSGSKAPAIINDPQYFGGCGGNGVYDLNRVEFRNDGWGEKWVCMDRVELI